MGHGDFIDFGTSKRTDPNEYLSQFLHLFTERRDGPIHDTLGMMLSGMTYTIFPALAAGIFANPIWLLWLPLGALKGVAYALAWDFKKTIANPTVLAEYLTGFLICGATGLLWLIAQ